MRTTKSSIAGFTLMELMTVVVIIGIVAAFAIPNYQKSIERTHAREAITNLTMIHAANFAYRAENGSFWPNGGPGNLADINSNLNLSIIANGMTYTCNGAAATFTCDADRDPPADAFTIRVTEVPIVPGNPSCVAGTCP